MICCSILHTAKLHSQHMPETKEKLYRLCEEYIQKRETEIKKIISDARDAANNETKSSAGDKYETGREVMQQEIDLNLTRLNEINKLKLTMERIAPDCKCETAQPGALVRTSNGNYYIAISAGQLKIDGTTYYAISAASPIGAEMIGKRSGDSFTLNRKQITIKSIS
jgi:transcription elongation GreA/GreB family factor